MNLPEEAYSRGSRDSLFHEKNFLLNYKNLIDLQSVKQDKAAYINKLASVNKLISGVDFSIPNILFICRSDIHKEVFLQAFSKLEKIQSYYYCNIMKLFDIWWGNQKEDNKNVPEEDVMYSEQDIRQDVFCLYIDDNMFAPKASRATNSVILSRDGMYNKQGEKFKNWVFYKGTVNSFSNNENYQDIYNLFLSGGSSYLVVELDSGNVVISKDISKDSKKVNKSNNLSEVY